MIEKTLVPCYAAGAWLCWRIGETGGIHSMPMASTEDAKAAALYINTLNGFVQPDSRSNFVPL